MTKAWIASLCIAMGLAPALSSAQASLDAVRQVQQFRDNLANLSAVVNKPLGPYDIGTRCPYCRTKIIWCVDEAVEVWGVHIDFSRSRNELLRVVGEANRDSQTFAASFAPAQAWISGLPGFSRSFNTHADRILAIEDEIKAGRGPTGVQRIRANLHLQMMLRELDASRQQLQAGTRALADALQRQSGYRTSIGNAMTALEQEAASQLAHLDTAARNQRCQTGTKEKFDAVKASYRVSANQIAAAFQALEASGKAAENGLGSLLATVTSAQTTVKSVQESVAAAQNAQLGSFLERLHLRAAKKQWSDLAASAGR